MCVMGIATFSGLKHLLRVRASLAQVTGINGSGCPFVTVTSESGSLSLVLGTCFAGLATVVKRNRRHWEPFTAAPIAGERRSHDNAKNRHPPAVLSILMRYVGSGLVYAKRHFNTRGALAL